MMRAGGFCLTPVWDVAPLFPLALVGTVLTLPSSPSQKKENRAQRNNCTKYSPAVAMATGPGASPTSATRSRFALDPERAPGCLAFSRANFRVRARSSGRGENGGGRARTWKTRQTHPAVLTFLRCSRRAFSSRAAELLLKLRNPRCCNASKSTLNY